MGFYCFLFSPFSVLNAETSQIESYKGYIKCCNESLIKKKLVIIFPVVFIQMYISDTSWAEELG